MKLRNVLVVHQIPETEEDRLTIKEVRRVLNKLKIKNVFINRDKIKKELIFKKDLIITIGGDGTFLRASHFIKNSEVIFGVNSDVNMKEGFFLEANRKNFEERMNRIVNGKFNIKKLSRLEAYLNDKKVADLAVNEFYIGSEKEYIASRYYLKVNGREERQKSSGILVATPAGSHAWLKSCGGKRIKLGTKKFEYCVREPFEGRLSGKYKLKREVLKKGRKITITSDMDNGLLVVDSMGKEHIFQKKDVLRIGISDNDLSVVFF